MLLDTRALRHLASEDWKVLAAVRVHHQGTTDTQLTMHVHRSNKEARTMSLYQHP
jgi:hypothetical protein